jgi:hypothetical protein
MRHLVFVFFALLLSCQKDATLEKVCVDPLGSQDIYLTNNTLICFREGHNACFLMRTTSTGATLTAQDYNKIYPGTMIGMIADMGFVSCLGDVSTKPTTGIFYGFTLQLNHGYVIKLPDDTYGRLFVDSWVKSSADLITEVHVTWQYSF